MECPTCKHGRDGPLSFEEWKAHQAVCPIRKAELREWYRQDRKRSREIRRMLRECTRLYGAIERSLLWLGLPASLVRFIAHVLYGIITVLGFLVMLNLVQ